MFICRFHYNDKKIKTCELNWLPRTGEFITIQNQEYIIDQIWYGADTIALPSPWVDIHLRKADISMTTNKKDLDKITYEDKYRTVILESTVNNDMFTIKLDQRGKVTGRSISSINLDVNSAEKLLYQLHSFVSKRKQIQMSAFITQQIEKYNGGGKK